MGDEIYVEIDDRTRLNKAVQLIESLLRRLWKKLRGPGVYGYKYAPEPTAPIKEGEAQLP